MENYPFVRNRQEAQMHILLFVRQIEKENRIGMT